MYSDNIITEYMILNCEEFKELGTITYNSDYIYTSYISKNNIKHRRLIDYNNMNKFIVEKRNKLLNALNE